ncbi:hypothetical protein Hanom_Chr01g00016581 [Helianthus anomalus]
MYGSNSVNLLLQHPHFHRLLRRHRMFYLLNLQRHLHRCFLLRLQLILAISVRWPYFFDGETLALTVASLYSISLLSRRISLPYP